MKKYFYISAVFLINTTNLLANELDNKFEFQMGISFLNMNYTEFAGDNSFFPVGTKLNNENGILPGISGKFIFYGTKFENVISGTYHSSEIDYDGLTQPPNSFPVQTETQTDIIDLQYLVREKSTQDNQIYLGVGYRYWRRDILSTIAYDPFDNALKPVSGFLEFYDWFYGIIGIYSTVYKSADTEFGLDVRFTQMLKANIEINLENYGCPDTTLDLGKKLNYRLALPWRKMLSNSYTWVVEPFYEQWDIGESNTATVTCSSGFAQVNEPRSETRNLGVNFQLVIPF